MLSLLAATLLWALSFGLVARYLGGLDPNFVAAARLLLALPLFVPLLRLRGLALRTALALVVIGALQFGAMYVAYIAAFAFASAHEVALYTVLTPIYVALVHDAYARRLDVKQLGLATLAVAGAALIQHRSDADAAWLGFGLVQLANLCFAWGQVAYRRLRHHEPELRDHQVFALLYAGGLFVTAAATTARGTWASALALTPTQLVVLAYLGIGASGLGFFLWNRGAVQVPAGVLAVTNNLKVPLAVLAALTIFGERSDLVRLGLGGGLMILAAALASPSPRPSSR